MHVRSLHHEESASTATIALTAFTAAAAAVASITALLTAAAAITAVASAIAATLVAAAAIAATLITAAATVVAAAAVAAAAIAAAIAVAAARQLPNHGQHICAYKQPIPQLQRTNAALRIVHRSPRSASLGPRRLHERGFGHAGGHPRLRHKHIHQPG